MILSKVYEDAERRLERNEITLGEFERLVDIEVIEPKRGEWIYHKNDMSCVRWSKWECSICHERVEHKSNFCPNCGADMRKKTVDYKHVTLTCDDKGNWSMHGDCKEGIDDEVN